MEQAYDALLPWQSTSAPAPAANMSICFPQLNATCLLADAPMRVAEMVSPNSSSIAAYLSSPEYVVQIAAPTVPVRALAAAARQTSFTVSWMEPAPVTDTSNLVLGFRVLVYFDTPGNAYNFSAISKYQTPLPLLLVEQYVPADTRSNYMLPVSGCPNGTCVAIFTVYQIVVITVGSPM